MQVDKPVILSVETSGRTGSVAVGQGDEILGENIFSGIMRHSAELFAGIETLLRGIGRKPADIEHIYITVGPGSFTGLRIATTMAKLMAFANNTKIVAVNTSDVIMAGLPAHITETRPQIKRAATILDAKRKQFFVAVFERSPAGWTKVVDDCLMTSQQFISRFSGVGGDWLLGEGLVYYKDAFCAEGIEFFDEKYWCPNARGLYIAGRKMAKAAQFADPELLVPLYLRQTQAEENLTPPPHQCGQKNI